MILIRDDFGALPQVTYDKVSFSVFTTNYYLFFVILPGNLVPTPRSTS